MDAFCRWLESEGWSVEREVAFCDVVATRGADRLYAEAKGRTAAPGLDIDTLYGQLLRRMPEEEFGRGEFAVVVPSDHVAKALRVPPRVRALLGVRVYGVGEDGQVTIHR
ncbi:hypothetical protein GCM10009845_21040 [Pedococcus bigeumensis]